LLDGRCRSKSEFLARLAYRRRGRFITFQQDRWQCRLTDCFSGGFRFRISGFSPGRAGPGCTSGRCFACLDRRFLCFHKGVLPTGCSFFLPRETTCQAISAQWGFCLMTPAEKAYLSRKNQTSNNQHPTSNIQCSSIQLFHWMLVVRCWMLDVAARSFPSKTACQTCACVLIRFQRTAHEPSQRQHQQHQLRAG